MPRGRKATTIRFSTEVLGDLPEKLRQPGAAAEPLRDLLEEAAKIGQRVATDAVDGGRGIAVRSLYSKVRSLDMRVASTMPRARASSIERGRKPGQRPAIGQITRWAKAVGISESPYKLRAEIRKRGVAAKNFIAQGRSAVQAAFPRLTKELATQVLRRIRK
jgi:hypothetical protein